MKSITKRSEDVATATLTGVVKFSETVTGSVVNSRVGKIFFNMFPGEIILASFDGFRMCSTSCCFIVLMLTEMIFLIMCAFLTELVVFFFFFYVTEKICDAVEVAGKNVMSTSSLVTTDLVTER